MRFHRIGVACILSACSSDNFDPGLFERAARDLTLEDSGDAGTPERLGSPLEDQELPFVLRSVGCDGCEPVEVFSSVSQEEMDERSPRRALDEFEFNREKNLASYQLTTRQVVERANSLLDAGEPDTSINLAIYLPEFFFEFERLREADDSALKRLLAERTAQLAPSQEAVRQLVEKLGGKMGGSLQLANIVYAQVPASSIAALVQATDTIIGLEVDDQQVSPDADGIQRRRALLMNDDALQYWGWDGEQANRLSNGPIRVAVVEANPPGVANTLNTLHSGLREEDPAASATLRVIGHESCNASNSPACALAASSNITSHGTNVTSVLLSDFEDGQANDTNPTWTTATRQLRGGTASEAAVFYYYGTLASAAAAAVNDAVYMGADVINMSQSPSGNYCSNDSFDGLRAAIQAAENSGVLVVVSAGNKGDLVNCRVNSFGAIPDTLTVGAVADVVDHTSLATVGIQSYAPVNPGDPTTFSGGNAPSQTIGIAGGVNASARMVELAVTGDADLVAGNGATGTASVVGTSFAAPQVAGAAAILKHWMYNSGSYNGVWRNDPYVLSALLTVMGDGASGTGGGGQTQTALDNNFGFGHLRFTVPAFVDGTYGYHRVLPYHDLVEGQEIEFYVGKNSGAEPTQIKGWKLAALVDHDWYDSSPVITLQLRDRCPSGGGSYVPILNSTITTHKARLRMRATDMATQYHNRCLYVRAYVAKADGPFSLYLGEYAYTNSRANHDM